MRVFRWEEIIADNGTALSAFLRSWAEEATHRKGAKVFSALTVGDFDGCHLGHAALFEKIAAASKKSRLKAEKSQGAAPCVLVPGAVTFQRQPSSPEKNGKPAPCISTLRQRFEAMEGHGFAFVLLIDFSYNFSRMLGCDFLKILTEKAHMRYLCVGEDFRCGFNLGTGQREISQAADDLSFVFEPVAQVVLDGKRVSSTEIREAVLRADFIAAEKLMGRPFALDIAEVSFQLLTGKSAGQDLSTFYAKPSAFSQILPPVGRYSAVLSGNEAKPAECFFSFDGQAVLLECEKKFSLCRGRIAADAMSGTFFDSLGFCKRD